MTEDSHLQRLHRLIDHHLRRFTQVHGGALAAPTKEEEKKILISLSKVLRQVQDWGSELGSCSEDGDSLSAVALVSTAEVLEVKLLLCRIVGDLIQFLTVESRHVHHLVGNVLLATSELLISSMKDWTTYVHVIFVCAELSMKSFLSCSAAMTRPVDKNLNCIAEDCSLLLKPKLPEARWSAVAELFRVLRCMWKYLKKDDNEQLAVVFLNYLSSFLSDIAWNSLNDIIFHESIADKRGAWVKHFSSNIALERPELTFLGYFVQLLCSAVEKVPTRLQCGSHNDKLLHFQVTSVVPYLFRWCLGKQGVDKGCISMYFRHKLLVQRHRMLDLVYWLDEFGQVKSSLLWSFDRVSVVAAFASGMLMIRLSSHKMEASILVLWLKLLHEHFEGFLLEPIFTLKFSQDESLESSPFVVQIFGEESHCPLDHHLKRQAIFLFLRCSFGLINQERESNEECECTAAISWSNLDIECCSRRKGFLELHKWLQDNLYNNKCLDNQLNAEEYLNFASSFLHLYVNEDDLLFTVLLQLLSLPSRGVQRSNGLNRVASHSNEEILWHLSNIFDPIILFHLFLEQMHYDHTVLLDYLISRDTGVSSVEYLLRSLRLTCDSWQAFIEFPRSIDINKSSSVKRRKVAIECSESQGEAPLMPVGNGMFVLLNRGGEKHQDQRHKFHRTRGEHFNKAKECMLSLRYAVQNLQQKKLFPYNPRVLLRRLIEFQELCFKQDSRNCDS